MQNILEFSGERFVPGEAVGDIELEHLHRYLLASEHVHGKLVLDIASGAGYGSSILATKAQQVIGVDIAEEAVKFASERYATQNLEFRVGSCSAIPLEENTVDVVVSFETIEHHAEHEQMMSEIKRVLKPEGFLILSSPDKFEYSEKPKYHNEFHVKELYKDEFRLLLLKYFKKISIYGQKISYGSMILSEDESSKSKSFFFEDSSIQSCKGLPQALYLIAVASDGPLPKLFNGVFSAQLHESDSFKKISEHTKRQEKALKLLKDTVNNLIVERDAYKMAVDDLVAELEHIKGHI